MVDVNPETDSLAWHGLTRLAALVELDERTALGEEMPIVDLLKSLATKKDVATVEVTPDAIEDLARALEPAIETALANVLARIGVVVRPEA